jgi:hypothetical protein
MQYLEEVFPDYIVHFTRQQPAPADAVTPALEARPSPPPRLTGSNRDKVLAVTTDSYASVQEIADLTSLEVRQIRGVINAPDMLFEREDRNGVACYKYAGTRHRER